MEWVIVSRVQDGHITTLQGYRVNHPTKCEYTTLDIKIAHLTLAEALSTRSYFHEGEALVVQDEQNAYVITVEISEHPGDAARRELDETVEHVPLMECWVDSKSPYYVYFPAMVCCCLYGLVSAIV